MRAAHGVPPSAVGSDQRSSVGHSRGGSSDRLAVGGHRGRSERKSSSLPATRSQGRPGGHAAMQPPPQKPPWTQMKPFICILYAIMFLCDSRLPAFRPRPHGASWSRNNRASVHRSAAVQHFARAMRCKTAMRHGFFDHGSRAGQCTHLERR